MRLHIRQQLVELCQTRHGRAARRGDDVTGLEAGPRGRTALRDVEYDETVGCVRLDQPDAQPGPRERRAVSDRTEGTGDDLNAADVGAQPLRHRRMRRRGQDPQVSA